MLIINIIDNGEDMIYFTKSNLGNEYLSELKEMINEWLNQEKIIIKEDIYLTFATGNYVGTNIYYCNSSVKKTAKFIKNIFENEGGNVRCFSFLEHPRYDIYIEIGYLDNINEINYIKNIINKIFISISKTYMIINKGYYLPLEIY